MPDPIENADGAEPIARNTMLLENCARCFLLRQIRRERIARSADGIQKHNPAPPQPAAPYSPGPMPTRVSQSKDHRRRQVRLAQTLDAAALRGLVGCDGGLAGNAQPELLQRLSQQAWRPCSPPVSSSAEQEKRRYSSHSAAEMRLNSVA